MSLIQLAERRWLPDNLFRFGMRRLLQERLQSEKALAGNDYSGAVDLFASKMKRSAVTIATHLANEQHYEVPAEFFQLVLGSHLKYSCGLWSNGANDLDASEAAMLALSSSRAGIVDGMNVLDLGCGWGSLSLWIAERYPNCKITSLSNSTSQAAYIKQRCQEQGLTNVDTVTSDIALFDTSDRFDRIVSVEMFEHVRNHEQLFKNIRRWLVEDGKLFVHIFCHRQLAYLFETDGAKNWMGQHFFTGGMMPSENLFHRYRNDLQVTDQWWINGLHYAQTSEHWLQRLDQHENSVAGILETAAKNQEPANVLLQRWRMFFMACAELFHFDNGQQWGVSHYLFEPSDGSSSGRQGSK